MCARVRQRRAEPEPPAPIEQELQSLSYAVAHDLSASVRYMASFSRLLIGELGAEVTERQQLYADQLRAAGGPCAAMLEQLAAYSQVQSRNLTKALHDPTADIRLIGMRLAAAVSDGAEIVVAPLGVVYAEPDLLMQAASAVLDNAFKFRRRDAPLRVAVAPAHDAAFWRMRVSDNGIGVEPRHREVAFAMFRRLNGADAFPGVGAGLAICRRIARRHGGEARFVDCAEGACLEFSVPHPGALSNRRARTSL